jgi:hypothetical protein
MALDDVNVVITVQDTKVTQAGFGTILILGEHTVFTDRTKSYADLTEVAADFATTTKIYKAANAVFAQSPAPQSLKVGRIDAGDADLTATLNAIVDLDNDWYGLILESRLTADILAAAAWIETTTKVFGISSEDADILTAVTTDIFSVLQALSYNRTYTFYSHQAGVDVTGTAITVTSEVATVTQALHGLRVNDPITISGAIDFGADADVLNGNFIVASVPTTGTFTYAAPGAADGAATGTINYFAKYVFAEAAWMGLEFAKDPGLSTWKFKTLAGIAATPQTLMSSSQKAIVEGKGANIYISVAGVSMTREGIMVSGRFIDVTRGTDWLDARLEERIFTDLVNLEKIPYTNAGMTIIEGAVREILSLAIKKGVINPVSDSQDYILTVPNVFDIPVADRQNRLFPDITFQALVGNAVHGVQVNGTLQV